jgi:hypothetical protein
MKKLVLSTLAALLLASPAAAQYYPDGRPIPPRHRYGYSSGYNSSRYDYNTYYGFRIGLGVGTVNSDSPYLDGNKATTGLNAGFVVGTQLTNRAPLYFETGLYYTEKGGKSTYQGNKFTYGLDYLEVPLLLKYKYYADRDFSIEPFMGGYLSCGVAGKIKDFGNREAYNSFGDDYNENFKRFDGGLKFGCGLGFQMLYLEASYDIGLANVGNDEFDDTHTGCFNLTFGVNF